MEDQPARCLQRHPILDDPHWVAPTRVGLRPAPTGGIALRAVMMVSQQHSTIVLADARDTDRKIMHTIVAILL
jgi:hypothetical protein